MAGKGKTGPLSTQELLEQLASNLSSQTDEVSEIKELLQAVLDKLKDIEKKL